MQGNKQPNIEIAPTNIKEIYCYYYCYYYFYISRNFLNILDVPNKTVLQTCPISAVIPVPFNLLPNYLSIAPKEPTTNGIIVTLTFQIFCNSLLRS